MAALGYLQSKLKANGVALTVITISFLGNGLILLHKLVTKR
jgi:hypothetical protein